MTAPNKLQLVSHTEAPQAPYPADLRANGWGFQIDVDRLEQSDTWALASPDMRPWLLMLWMTAWKQRPMGSLPSEPALIAARIGMPERMFEAHRDVLLRGWRLHADGKLYHPTITELVFKVADRRRNDTERMQAWRSKRKDGEAVTRDKRVTHMQVTHGYDTGTVTGTGEKTHCMSTCNVSHPDGEPPEREALSLVGDDEPNTQGSTTYRPPPCPADAIVNLYHEHCPSLPQCVVVTPARQRSIAARWRDVAAGERYTRAQTLEWFAWFFEHVAKSDFLMGRAKANRDGRTFRADLNWLMRPENFAKVVERRYHG